MGENGIIVVQMNPDNSLEILTLSGVYQETVNQIAAIMGYPVGVPIDSWNSARLTAVSWLGRPSAAKRPEDAILLWRKVENATKGQPVNFMASNVVTQHQGSLGAHGSIYGTAVFSGYDLENGAITSAPLLTLQHLLGMAAYHEASDQIRMWRQAKGL